MLSLLSLALSALPLVAAQGLAVSGPFLPGNINTSDARQVYDTAARNSDNKLGTISSPGFQLLLNNSIAFPLLWNWTTNVADFAIPVPEGDLGRPGADYSQGYHVVNTQHRLNWTAYLNDTESDAIRGKSLQTILRDTNVTLQLGFLPMNYVAGFTPIKREHRTIDCADSIGLKCWRSLYEAFSNSSNRFIQTDSLPGCNATIVDTSVTRLNMSDPLPVPLNSGDSFYYSQKPLGNTGNKTLLERELSTGVIQIWNWEYPTSNGTSNVVNVLCLQAKSAASLSSQPMVTMAVATAIAVGMFVAVV